MRTLVWTICTGLLLAVPATSSAADYLPGGEATQKAVAARRGKTALSRLADSMAPGTWAKLETDMPPKLWSAPGGKGLHIGTWSDDAHWDSQSGQLLFFGVRQARKFVAYDEMKNAWRVIPLPEDHEAHNSPAILQKFGHQYSNNAFDPERRQFYTTTYRYDLASETWSQLPEPPSANGAMTYEFSSAHNGLLMLTRHSGNLQLFSLERQQWEPVGKIAVHGYHSLARHNPLRDEVLFAGGNDSQAVVILAKDGTTKRMKDFPSPLTIRQSLVTVDPVSGNYLMIGNDREAFYEFDSQKNEYRRLSTPVPWSGVTPQTSFIPEYGVTIWADSEVWLYKHDAKPSK